jgi:transcriptional antiterminator RfaH
MARLVAYLSYLKVAAYATLVCLIHTISIDAGSFASSTCGSLPVFYFNTGHKVMEQSSISNISEPAIEGTARWYVIHTHPKQEDRAGSNLKVLGVPIFNPKILEPRYNQFMYAPAYVAKPLFPRYMFAQFRVEDLYHKVRFTRGVNSVVSFGAAPAPIDDEIIMLIQSNVKKDGFIRIDEEIKPGDRVIVKDGPLKYFAGIFERKMKDADRVRILLQTVSFQAHVEIDIDMVTKARS